MPMVKVLEVLADSPDSFDDAVRVAVDKASRTVRDIKSVYVKEMTAQVEGGKVIAFRVNAKISFLLED
jgi:flavin-binding protein dodecin